MNVLQLIGNTPLVKLKDIDTGCCELFLKLESQNPGGSIKDRIAMTMIKDAEDKGLLKPGGTIVEATAGNTGLGLALVAGQKGYKIILVIFDKVTREKIQQLQALGAEVVLTRTDVPKGHPDHYQDKAASIAASIPGAWYVNQFANEANPLAHELTTGPEIWSQMDEKLDAVVCGVGSGGTITGLGRYFKKVAPSVEMILADPVGSILAHYAKTGEIKETAGQWLVEGIGDDFIPPVADFSLISKTYSIPDKESIDIIREVLKTNAIMGRSSSGTLIAAALRYCREQKTPKRVVTFICDSGQRYISKMYNNTWLHENGLLNRDQFGDLRDLISRLHSAKDAIVIGPTESIQSAYARMKAYDVSQLPVVDGEKIVGILDESDLLMAIYKDSSKFKAPVSEVMSSNLEIIDPKDKVEKLIPLFEKGMVALIADNTRFYGIVTKMDLLLH